nr:VanZ family protein [Paenibacillus castaneae]
MPLNVILFVAALIYALIMGFLLFHRPRYYGDGFMYNLVPFQTIKQYIFSRNHYNSDIWVKNLFGNIVLFIPIGIFLPMLQPFFRKGFVLLIATIVLITGVELTQMLTRVGSFDIDDIILNTFGAMAGLLLIKAVFRRY